MRLITISFFLFSLTTAFGQNPVTFDKFIKIVGNAELTYEADGVMLEFTLSEVPPNEYKKMRYVPIETVEEQFYALLAKEGLNKNDLISDPMQISKSRKYKTNLTKYLKIKIKDEEKASRIIQSNIDGFELSKLEYSYPKLDDSKDEKLAIDAIKDATRKAENIAKAIGRELGGILNIAENVSRLGTSASRYAQSKQKTKSLTYRMDVTFELK